MAKIKPDAQTQSEQNQADHTQAQQHLANIHQSRHVSEITDLEVSEVTKAVQNNIGRPAIQSAIESGANQIKAFVNPDVTRTPDGDISPFVLTEGINLDSSIVTNTFTSASSLIAADPNNPNTILTTAADFSEIDNENIRGVFVPSEEINASERLTNTTTLDTETTPVTTNNEENTTAASTQEQLDNNITLSEPSLTITQSSGSEDGAIPLNIVATQSDSADSTATLIITISGVPDGAELSAGTDNGDGSWSLTSDQLADLTITPAANSSDDFNLTVTAPSSETGGDTATNSQTLSVLVTGIADTPTLSVANSQGIRGQAIDLDLAGQLTDLDGSESLSFTIGNVPDEATLSAGTDHGGTWTVTEEQLDGLNIAFAEDYAGGEGFAAVELTVTAVSTENDGDTSEQSATLTVNLLNEITGTDGRNTLRGTDDGDYIQGLQGNDKLYGKEGDDVLYGNEGNDRLYGEEGNDYLRADSGDDTLYGGAGDDFMKGGDQADVFIFGHGDGHDTAEGGTGSWTDTIQLNNVNQGPTDTIQGEGSWTLEINNDSVEYMINEENNVLEFSQDNGSGTIVLSDGSELTFTQMEKIQW